MTATIGGVTAIVVCFVGIGRISKDADTPARGAPVELGPAHAGAELDWGVDTDGDGLSDEIEALVGGNKFLADTDGDGFDDAVEWTLGSNPASAMSVPEPHPSVRTYAYETNGVIRVFCAVYPANVDLVNSFHLLIGSTEFTGAPDGDPGTGIGVLDVTPLISTMADSYTETRFLGLSLIGFDFDLDVRELGEYGPLNVAVAGKLADVTVVSQLMLGTQGSSDFVLTTGPSLVGSTAGSFVAEPLNPIEPIFDELPEYCAVTLSSGTPVGFASVQYQVASAACEPDGLMYCIDADCTALQGQTFTLIDYGYLQSKSDF